MSEFKYTLPEGYLTELKCTVRTCLDCGCLVSGGPTRCTRCVRDLEYNTLGPWQRLKWLLFKKLRFK